MTHTLIGLVKSGQHTDMNKRDYLAMMTGNARLDP